MEFHRLAPVVVGDVRFGCDRYVDERCSEKEDWRRACLQHRAAVCEEIDMALLFAAQDVELFERLG